MIHQDQINKITSLIAALQQYAKTRTEMGLYDVGASIEVLISEVLRITEGLNLTNQNLIKVNFPSIDLADDRVGIAIQVTSNVSTEKWKETVKKFTEHKLNERYKSLRIIGFCRAVKPRNCPKFASVEGLDSILQQLKTLKPSALRELEELLRESYDFSKLSPLNDRDCFGVVLGVLDRDAIRHYTRVEGSFSKLSKALKEIREIINSGQIKEKNIYAKPIYQYSPPYEEVLRDIDFSLSVMLAEVNRGKRGIHYGLRPGLPRQRVDDARTHIIRRVNEFCRAQGIDREIVGIS